MKSKAALTEQLRKAMAHPMFRELLEIIPAADKQNQARLHSWLTEAAKLDPRGARREPFIRANQALKELVRAQKVENQLASLYHDPAIRQLTGARHDELFSDPVLARQAISDLLKNDPKTYYSKPVQAALGLLVEHGDFLAGEPPPETPPETPAERPPAIEAELAAAIALGRTDAATYRSAEHQQRLVDLAAGKTPARPQQSTARAELDRMMAVRTSNYGEYKQAEFQVRLAEVANAAAAEKQAAAAPPPVTSAPPPQTAPQQGE